MSEAEPPSHPEIREAVRRLCADFPGEYWQRLDRDRIYPAEFVRTLNEAGFLSILIPEQYGGSGLGLGAATAVLEEIHRSGRSEEHTSELQSLIRNSYAVFCLKKKNQQENI